MAKDVVLWEALDRYAHGGKVSGNEAKAGFVAAAAFRHEILTDAFKALVNADPASPTFKEFTNCIHSMGETLVRHGIISGKEMNRLWAGIEMVQRGEVLTEAIARRLMTGELVG